MQAAMDNSMNPIELPQSLVAMEFMYPTPSINESRNLTTTEFLNASGGRSVTFQTPATATATGTRATTRWARGSSGTRLASLWTLAGSYT